MPEAESLHAMSPIHKVLKRLPFSPPASFGPATSSPLPTQARKRARTAPLMSAHDMRRLVLFNQVQKRRLGSGVTITRIDAPNNNYPKPDLCKDKPHDESVVEVEHDENYMVSKNNENDPSIIEVQEGDEIEDENLVSGPTEGDAQKNVCAVEWVSVKRIKRKVRLYMFQEEEGVKPEVLTIQANTNLKIPSILNGRRSLVIVPGIDYGLGEGEGVLVDNDEERRQIKLANNEKYVMDSFFVDNGFLSESEMMETPVLEKGCLKAKQKRRAGTVQARLKFDQFSEPEIIGCFWRVGLKGGANSKVKKWSSLVISSTPIPTSYSTPVPQDISENNPPPQGSGSSATSGDVSEDFAKRYAIKYLVKHIVSTCYTTSGTIDVDKIRTIIHSNSSDIRKKDLFNIEKYLIKYSNKFKVLKASI